MQKYIDLSGKFLSQIESSEVPNDVESIDLSNNEIICLPDDFFLKKHKLWNVLLNNNRIDNTKFISCFRGLNNLDLRNNQLEIDDILPIRHIFLIHLRISGNPLLNHFKSHNIALIALLKHVWILDGTFITDSERKRAKTFKTTLSFGEKILEARKNKEKQLKIASISQAATAFIKGVSCKFVEPGSFLHPLSAPIQALTKRPQIERLKHLLMLNPIELPQGTFLDYFSIVLALLHSLWVNGSISLVPRLLSRSYWFLLSEKLEKSENWEKWLYLLKLSECIKPIQPVECELWKAMAVNKYLETGEPPLIGSIPRLVLFSYIYRSIDPEDYLLNDDLVLYQRFRDAAGVSSLDDDIISIHREIIAPIPPAHQIPKKGDKISVYHPLEKDWVVSTTIGSKNGRVFSQYDSIVFHLPSMSLFFDGRGIWKEAYIQEKHEKPKVNDSTFMTEGETEKEQENQQTESKTKSITLPQLKKPRIAPSDPQFFLKSNQIMLSKSPFIERKVMKQELFRGIVDPKAPIRNTIPKTAPSRRPNQFVNGVVNVILGQELSNGHKLRKFHVKLHNPITNKSQYIWINEDEVSEDDVKRLVDLYKTHIESKMAIVPGL